jgi:PAS domain S-box-containing protein
MAKKSIRRRLNIAFISLVITPLAVFGGILSWQSFIAQLKQAQELQHQIAKHTLEEILFLIHEQEHELRVIAKTNNLMNLGRDQQYKILSKYRSHKGAWLKDVINDLIILDRKGLVKNHVSRLSIITSADFDDRSQTDEFVIPMNKGQTYYSPVWFNKDTGEPLMNMCLPIINLRNGLVTGVLVGQIRLKEVWSLISETRIGERGSVYIVDSKGQILAHKNPSIVLKGTTIKNWPYLSGIHTGIDGTYVQQAIEEFQMGNQTIYVVTERPLSEVLNLTIRTALIICLLFMLLMGSAIALGLFVKRRIVQPVENLASTAQTIAAGDFSVQAEVAHDDELGVLARVFNTMAAQLTGKIDSLEKEIAARKQAQEALRESQKRLKTIVDSIQTGVIIIDVETRTIIDVNPAATRIIGAPMEQIIGQICHKHICPAEKGECPIIDLGQKVDNSERALIRADGEEVPILKTVTPIFLASKECLLESFLELTEKKKLEAQLQ